MKLNMWVATLPFLSGLLVGGAAHPAHAEGSWVLNHCNNAASVPFTLFREAARGYSLTANGDGYDWGGGCWNSDGVDNTPNQNGPNNSVGEGADCSGFTFKTWGLTADGALNRRHWQQLTNTHGPYTAASFASGWGASNVLPDKTFATTNFMDAFASSTHIGMIHVESTSGGLDSIVEAKDQQTNMGVFMRGYRSAPEFVGVKRAIWDAYCPTC